MSSQSRGSLISESDDSESEYSSVEERYGSGRWACCRISMEHGIGWGSWCFASLIRVVMVLGSFGIYLLRVKINAEGHGK